MRCGAEALVGGGCSSKGNVVVVGDSPAQRVLGMSKIVYRVSTGKLETILPALLDKLDAEQVTPAVWDIDRFNWEFLPHLLRVSDEFAAGRQRF